MTAEDVLFVVGLPVLGFAFAILLLLLPIGRQLELMQSSLQLILKKLDLDMKMERLQMATSKELLELSRSIKTTAQADLDATHALVGALNDTKALYDRAIADLAAAQSSENQAEIDEAFANLQSVSDMIDAEAVVKAAVKGTPAESVVAVE